MSVPPNQRQVSLRGSSAKEITRDALLEKVSHERELRSYLRRASTASLFIQRVWRRYYNMKKASVQLREEWDALSDRHSNSIAKNYVSEELLRPFLFFITQSPWSNQNQDPNLVNCASFCFNILLTSINSPDPDKNFCSLVIGTKQERSTWLYQSKKLVSLCSSILSQCNFSNSRVDNEKTTQLSLLSMRLSISLTDTKTWKFLNNDTSTNANTSLKKLIAFMATRKSGLYNSIRKYIINLNSTRIVEKQIAPNEDGFLITASAITLALRPLNSKNMEIELKGFEIEEAYIEFIVFILTIPFLFKNLPPLLLPAMRHGSVLKPCLATLLISERKIFEEISKLEALNAEKLPHYGWILPNIINLATNYDHNSSGGIIEGLDCSQYIRSVNCVSRNFLNLLETNVNNKEVNLDNNESNNDSNIESSFIGLLAPVHQQWHLTKLLSLSKDDNTLELNDIMYFYYYMLRIFSILNPVIGSMPILNVLSFNPEFIVKLWVSLEKSIFVGANNCVITEIKPSSDTNSQTKQNKGIKDTKWVNVLQIIKGKSLDNDETGTAGTSNSESYINGDISNDDKLEIWDIEFLRKEYKNFPNELLYTMHLFCTSYGHLLLVLDDIEFYEKQVPFKLESQRKIASVLNTFVYNSFIRGNNSNNNNNNNNNKDLIEVATRCLHLLYERDLRHQFCPSSLWLAPARKDGALASFTAKPILTTIPHVYAFEERVKIFRELIKQDKITNQVISGGPGPGTIEIVVRRDQIVEDGYKQLNSLGSRLKSSIHVSFVSSCGLPEPGLDYGGLSKEFLTDLSKSALNPEYGLFEQSCESEVNLMPSLSARILPNGLEMIEFIGRVVGKALYEGILLDISFSLIFIQKLLGRYSFLDELSSLDSQLYRNLMHLKYYDGDVRELCLDFTLTEELCGRMIVHELRPGGRNVQVNNENKLQYVHSMADFKLNRQIVPFANAFYRGLSDLISPSWLSLFNANEFNQLLSGGNQDFDVDDLKDNTKYTGGYSESSRTVKLFWEVIKGFNAKERSMLLKFVTSCSRAPLLGFKYLHPSFTIHKVACDVPIWATLGGQDVDRLPSASTCYNTLKLPTYKRSSTLRSKLLYSISSNAGFELS